MYQIGELTNCSEGDFHCDDIQEAYTTALAMSEDANENAFGIWTDEGDTLLAIAHNGDLFLKAN